MEVEGVVVVTLMCMLRVTSVVTLVLLTPVGVVMDVTPSPMVWKGVDT